MKKYEKRVKWQLTETDESEKTYRFEIINNMHLLLFITIGIIHMIYNIVIHI